MNSHTNHLCYALITPARNEQSRIEKTIESVINQTHLPCRWIIVDDGSSDSTASIVRRHTREHGWIRLVEMPAHRDRSFAAKVHCFNAGYEQVRDLQCDVIGNLDADVSFDAGYFEFLLDKFGKDPHLGVAGTIFKEDGYSSETESFEGQSHVSGGCQLFRQKCFEEIGGYTPNKAGGIDWIAVATARMRGWKTQSFREKAFFHHRSLGTAERGMLAAAFSYGEKDYYLGGHPVWELFRITYQMARRPYFVRGMSLGLGYLWAFIRRIERPVSPELMRFHRREQLTKLKAILKSLLTFRKVDPFQVRPS